MILIEEPSLPVAATAVAVGATLVRVPVDPAQLENVVPSCAFTLLGNVPGSVKVA